MAAPKMFCIYITTTVLLYNIFIDKDIWLGTKSPFFGVPTLVYDNIAINISQIYITFCSPVYQSLKNCDHFEMIYFCFFLWYWGGGGYDVSC